MAKQRKKQRRRQKKSFLLELAVFFVFFIFVFGLFQLGKSFLRPDKSHLPSNAQDRTPVALGIDVSEWNTDIDWQTVKDEGYSFVIIRTSFGVNDTQDSRVFEHIEGAKNAGLDIGAYHYSHATTVDEALAEANFVISVLDKYQWDYPVYYDIETDRQDHLSKDELTEIVKTFLTRISDAGYQPGLYASQYWLEHRLNMEELEDYAIWIASYTSHLTYEGQFDMWQYTKSGQINGIDGDVDIDILY